MKRLFFTAVLLSVAYCSSAQTSAAPKMEIAKPATSQTEYAYLTAGLNNQAPLMEGYRLDPVMSKNVMGKYKVDVKKLSEGENTKALSIVITEVKNNESHYAVISVNNKELGRKNTIDVESTFPNEVKTVYHMFLEVLLSESLSK